MSKCRQVDQWHCMASFPGAMATIQGYPTRLATSTVAERMPSEVWDMIVGFVPKEGWGTLRAVCKRLHAVVQRRLRDGKVPPTPHSYAALSSALHQWVYRKPVHALWRMGVCERYARYGMHEQLVDAHRNQNYQLGAAECKAARGGHLQCLRYVMQQPDRKGYYEPDLLEAAARSGSLGCVRYIIQTVYVPDITWDMDEMMAAAYGGNPECMRLLHTETLSEEYNQRHWYVNYDYGEYTTAPPIAAILMAITDGHAVETDDEFAVRIPAAAMMAAIEGGNVACLITGRALGMPLHSSLATAAAVLGEVECLQQLYEWGCPFDELIAYKAACAGQLATLKLLHVWRVGEWNRELAVAATPHLPCLQYIHESGIRPPAYVMCRAARIGKLECLQYLHRHCCRLNADVMNAAAEGGHPDCVQYVLDNGCKPTASLAHYYIERRDVKGLQRVLDVGVVPTDDMVGDACRYGSKDCLVLLHKRHVPCDARECYALAINHNHMDCLKYLHKHYPYKHNWIYYILRSYSQPGPNECLKYVESLHSRENTQCIVME